MLAIKKKSLTKISTGLRTQHKDVFLNMIYLNAMFNKEFKSGLNFTYIDWDVEK